MATRPGIDQRAGHVQQPKHPVHRQRQQPQTANQREEDPETRFVAEAVIGDQHITGALADRPAEQTCDREQQNEDQNQTSHVRWASCSASCASG